MLKIAITGNIASGKSETEKFLRKKGYSVLDTDEVTHKLLEDKAVKEVIKKVFAGHDICENNKISRTKLGKLVFDDDKLKMKLEKILHPIIKEKIEIFFDEKKNEKMVFVTVPLLFEAHFEKYFDKIILIYANDEKRLKRLIQRDNFSKEYAIKRINSQISQEKKLTLCDYTIYSDKSLSELHNEINTLLGLL